MGFKNKRKRSASDKKQDRNPEKDDILASSRYPLAETVFNRSRLEFVKEYFAQRYRLDDFEKRVNEQMAAYEDAEKKVKTSRVIIIAPVLYSAGKIYWQKLICQMKMALSQSSIKSPKQYFPASKQPQKPMPKASNLYQTFTNSLAMLSSRKRINVSIECSMAK